jgi:hypothetical protein
MCSDGSVVPWLVIVALLSFLVGVWVSRRRYAKRFEKKYFEEFVKRPPRSGAPSVRP